MNNRPIFNPDQTVNQTQYYWFEKGFSEEEIVALASVEAFGVTRDPEQARWSTFPKFDNYYYKQVLTNAQGVPLSQALNSSPALLEHV